jgi:TonB-linked SusC/RagA family outer membrane protein
MLMKHLRLVGFIAIFCFLYESADAQNRTVTGKVTDKSDSSPLVGVSVMIKGTSTGTNTGTDGSFVLSVPDAATTLVFTYIGYESQQVDIAGKNTVNVSLSPSSTSLNEVVVIGYGSQRVQDATGSVASLSPRNFNKGVIASPEQLLQGRISGVQVTPSSGEPGAGININIRGASSIRSGNSPLFVVDGVPLDNSGTSGGLDAGAGTSSARNPLSFINPADIENISVLKDASAAAIYGSRGANGVVLITTKRGSSGQGIQFSASSSMSTTAKRYDLLNAADFITLATRAGADPAVINGGANTNWQDQIFRSVFSQNYNLSFGGSKNASNYRLSFGYDDQNGVVEKSGLKRLTGRLNASQGLFDEKIKIDLSFTASNIKNTYAPISDNAGFEGSLIGAAIIANPTYPVKVDDEYFTPGGAFRNPGNMLDYIDDSDNINRYLANISGTWNIIDNLSYKATFGLDHSDGKRSTWLDPHLLGYTGTQGFRSYNVPQVTDNGRGILQNQKLSSTLVEHTLTFNQKFGENELNLLGGYSFQQFKNFGWNDIGWNQVNKDIRAKSLDDFVDRLPGTFGDSTKSELQSFFARANYSHQDKYLLTLTFRVDGSSKFGENNKYGYFPAAAFKWKIMNEDFAPKNTFDELSLRINYGQTGNQEFPAYASLPITQRQLNGSNILISNASPNLKWETTTSYGAGIDFAILKSRLSGTIDYFNKSTKDLLFLQDYPAPSAATRRWINLPGNVVNNGIDLGLSFQAIQKESFNWEIVYNASIIKNTVKDFGSRNVITGDISGQGLSGAYSQVIRNDEPLGAFYMQKFLGFDNDGFSTYLNQELSGTYIVGSALPKFTTGLTNNFTFGQFNASVFVNAATGFYVYNNTANAYFLKGSLKNGRNVSYEAANSPENTLNSGGVSTRFLEKGDFLRLSNISLGYNFSMNNLKTIKSLRLSLSGQNLFIITNYSGLDPEVSTNKARLPAGSSDQREGIPSRGIDYTAYPNARTFTLSLNAGF